MSRTRKRNEENERRVEDKSKDYFVTFLRVPGLVNSVSVDSF